MPDPNSPTDPTDELVAAYTTGQTLEALAAAHGVSYHQVRNTLLAAGATMRPPQKQTQAAPPGLVDAYWHGLTIRAVGAQFGLSYGVTRRMLLASGIGLRPRGTPIEPCQSPYNFDETPQREPGA